MTPLACGFWDEGAELGALAWDLGGSGGLVARNGAGRPANVEIEPAGSGLKLRLDDGQGPLDAELAPRGEEPAMALCDASVTLGGASPRSLECSGHLTRWSASPLEGNATLRYLAIPAAEGALLLVVGQGGPDLEGHGEERVSAWLLDPEGRASPFAEAMLSTQYDEAGRQTRAGLELWPSDPDAPPARAAGTALGETSAAGSVTAALLRTSMQGSAGVGGYLIWRS